MSGLNRRLEELSARVDDWTREFVGASTFSEVGFRQMIAYHLGWANLDLETLTRTAPAGKRLRPALCLLVAEVVAGDLERAAAPAVAVELVHNFSLVHDDIQDGSELRRHRTTVWRQWGVAQAINVGDGLFALAQLALVSPRFQQPTAAIAAEAVARLNQTCLALVEGQYLDLELQAAEQVGLDDYERMIGGKTAALFGCAAQLGALYAGASSEQITAYGEFGWQLGLAFQYQDDLLGAWGAPETTGKPYAGDVRSRKRALPAVLAMRSAPERLRELYGRGHELSDSEVGEALALFERAGVRREAERMVEERYGRAMAELEAIAPRDSQLRELCQRLKERES